MQAVLPHSREDPHYLVLRPHGGDSCQALLDPRGAFVVELPDGMFVWQVSSPACRQGADWLQISLVAASKLERSPVRRLIMSSSNTARSL